MPKRPCAYIVYSVVALLISIYGFFYTAEVAAQTPSNLSDLTITKATLNGAALNFLYHNLGDGAAKPEISFWYELVDGQGRRLGNLYWLNVDGVAGKSKREGYQLLDSITLQWEHGKVKFGDLIHSAPPGAYNLKLTIDGPNAHKESNEQNNTVLLPILRTDFTITDAQFRNEFLSFRHYNRGNIGYPEGKKISFWFEWVDARGARVGDLYWFDATPPGTGSPRFAQLAEFDSKTTLFSAKGATSFTSFLNSAPNGSTHLKIAIDGPNQYAEFNEGNNIVLLKKLVNLGADLAIGSVVVKDRALHITARNIGVSDAPMADVTLMWLGIKPPSIEPVGLDPISAGKEMTVSISFDGLGVLNKMLDDPPEGAKQLRIFLDGNQKLVELNEGNNIALLDRSELTAPKLITPPLPDTAEAPRPKLTLFLSSEVVSRDGKTKEAYPGDDVRATLVVKNIGEASATGLSLSLYCPKNTALKSAELNDKDKKREALRPITAPNLGKDSRHRLVVVCTVGDKAIRNGKGTLTFTGTARLKEGNLTFKSNNVRMIVVQQPKKVKPPEVAAKPLPPPQTLLKKPEEPKPEPQNAFPRQDLSTDSDFGF